MTYDKTSLLENMKFLITGGAGFIGSNFLHLITNKYHKHSYTCLDTLNYAGDLGTMKLKMRLKNFKSIKSDIIGENYHFNS